MKNLILLLFCTAGPLSFAQDDGVPANNHVEPAAQARIEKACERQMATLTPKQLTGLKVPIKSLCDCLATEHVTKAKDDLANSEDARWYLDTVISFYSTATFEASKPVRRKSESVDNDDKGFFHSCNRR